MKIVFLGATNFSLEILNSLVENSFSIEKIITIPEEFKISYSETKVRNYNYAKLSEFAEKHGIQYIEIESLRGNRISDHYADLIKIMPDVILVMGWYYMVPKSIRDIPRYGTWGIHASLLPKYAGGAPLVWAIINGEKETGVTLFKLNGGVDDGDIIFQERITILEDDTIKEVYSNVIEVSKKILIKALNNIEHLTFIPQDKSKIEIYPQRKPDDGEIDMTWSAEKLYNFIRAQSSPYPGAFIRTSDGKKLIIEKARVEK